MPHFELRLHEVTSLVHPRSRARALLVLRSRVWRAGAGARHAFVTSLGAWVAIWLIAGPIASMTHYLVVPHTVCEHGDLVALHHLRGTYEQGPVQHAGPQKIAESRGPIDFEDEHCKVGAAASLHAPPGVCWSNLAAAARASLAVPPPYRERAPYARAVLHLAPKTSPPIV
jgi:hypothetical protein